MKINLSIVYAEEICKYFFGHVTAISTQKLQSDLIFKEDENFNCNQTLPSTHIKTIFQGNNFPLQYHAPKPFYTTSYPHQKFKYFLQNQFHVFTKIRGSRS